MKRNNFLLLLLSLSVGLLSMVGCSKSDEQFRVQGTISESEGQTLYLEYQGLTGAELIDSTVLQRKGSYRFDVPLPEYPDFYRLRLGKQVIPMAIDTIPSTTTINGDSRNFATSYSVESNQATLQIREVWLALLDANVALSKLEGSSLSSPELYVAQRDSIFDSYKEVARKYIYSNPRSPVAYFALFQQVDGNLVFNPYDKTDSKAFAAIANIYNTFQPENPRTKHLYDLALRSIAVVRQQERGEGVQGSSTELLKAAGVEETSYIDFTLPDREGREVTLSSVVAGRNVLLAFSTMQANWSAEFNSALAELYSQYGTRGLEIVQVGLDTDPHIWISATKALPWINLQDRDGSYSKLVGYYNLYRLPSLFLITKGGGELHRIESVAQLEQLLK